MHFIQTIENQNFAISYLNLANYLVLYKLAESTNNLNTSEKRKRENNIFCNIPSS